MNTHSTITLAVVASAAILAVLALIKFDFMAVALCVMAVFVLMYSEKHYDHHFGKTLLGFEVVGLIVLIAFYITDVLGLSGSIEFNSVSVIWMAELFVLPMITYSIGFQVAILFQISGQSVISSRWMMLFAVAFSMAFSGMYIFTVGFHLWYTGAPFYNAPGNHTAIPQEIIESNNLQMIAPTCFTVSVILVAIYFRYLHTHRNPVDLIGGGEQ